MGDNEDQIDYDYRHMYGPYVGVVKTPFATGKSMSQMKDMLANANPDGVKRVAESWKRVAGNLARDPDSAKAQFDKAVEHIMTHWEGPAAEAFQTKARQISKSINDCATYAEYTSTAMQHAGDVLATIKPEVDAIEEPGAVARGLDKIGNLGSRNEDWQGDIHNNQGAQKALDGHAGDLSEGKERQLQMAAKMETLAQAYTLQTSTMGSWTKRPPGQRHDSDDYPGEPGGVVPVPAPIPTQIAGPNSVAPTRGRTGGTVGSTKPSRDVKSPRETGITGGVQKPATGSKPQVGTAIDGITPPAGGAAGTGGTAGGAGGVGGTVGGGAGGGVGGGLPGGIGGAAAGARGGAAARGGAGGTAGRSGAAGRGGMPGAGGAGAGAGGRGGATAGRGGSLARRGGGVAGAAKGTGSGTRGTPGGSGLHRSRGAAGAGGGSNAGKGANRMMGRGQSGQAEEEERREGERPDYLVEDEETWTPERNVAPRVIE